MDPFAQTTTPPAAPGQLLAGKYRVERVLGEGGMGIVLLAINEALGQRVAIKLLRTGTFGQGEALARFEREARAAARLRTEHVARVLDVGKLEDGSPYMVLEYLEGNDLSHYIDGAPPLAVADAVDWLLQASEAVAEAHSLGIVHRDLKPKNLFLTTTVDGRHKVKVLDFGISKTVEGPHQDFALTRTSEIIGSPSYMSPEQLKSARDVDHRTDIWALGVILYELLTKQVPFGGNTITELVVSVLQDPTPDVRAIRPDVPEGIAIAIARCLAKDVNARYPAVVDFAQAIEPFASSLTSSAADRVRGVARISGRSLPPPAPTSSAQMVGGMHASTSVAWGETQLDPPKYVPARRWPLVLLGVVSVLLLTGAVGTLYVLQRPDPTHTANGPPSASADALPPGRKDLPPLGTAAIAEDADASAPSTLPTGREPVTPAPVDTTSKITPRRPGTKHGKQAPTPKPPDDLSNIGRR